MMLFKRCLISAMFSAMLITSAAGFAESPATETLLKKARVLEGEGRLDLATQTWKQLLMADPNQQEALAGLAAAAKQNGNQAEAATYLDRLRKLNPNHPALARVESMKTISSQRGRLEEAGRLASSQKFEAAMQIYRDVFGNSPPPGGWAIAYYDTEASTPGGWETATAGLQKLNKQYPDNQDYQLTLGRLYTYRPQTRENGMKLLSAIPESSPLAPKAQQAWRQALIWAGAGVQPVYLRGYMARYHDTELEHQLTQSKEPGSASAGPPVSKEEAAMGRENKSGFAALSANQLPEAESHFQTALKTNANDSQALMGMGFVKMKQEDFESAETYFAHAKTVTPNNKTLLESFDTAHFWKTMKLASKAAAGADPASAVPLYQQALAMRPKSLDAVQGLAGVYTQVDNATAAIPLWQQVVAAQPSNSQAWRYLINAQYKAGNFSDALATAHQLAPAVQTVLTKDPEYLMMLAFITSEAGDTKQSSDYFQQALALAHSQKKDLPVELQLEFAGLFLRSGKSNEAAAAFQRITDARPTNVDAWLGLLTALNQRKGNEVKAFGAVQRMPKEIYAKAARRPDFLRAVATLYTNTKRYDLALPFLQRAIELESAGDHEVSLNTQLQLADLWTKTSQSSKTEKLLQHLTETHPESAEVWNAWITKLHSDQRDTEALTEMQRIPEDAARKLSTDSTFIGLRASVYAKVGRQSEALELVRNEMSRLSAESRPAPVALEAQLAWLLLDQEESQQELYALLQSELTRHDLTPEDRQAFTDIWSVWIQRRAQAAVEGGDLNKGIGILRAGARFLPNDLKIRSNLAGNLMKAGDTRAAFEIYHAWGLQGAPATDYIAAVGAAMGVRDSSAANQWLNKGLMLYPRDPGLLNLAGKQAASKGDYKKAESFWSAALQRMPKDPIGGSVGTNSPLPGPDGNASTATRELGQLLLDGKPGSSGGSTGTMSAPPSAYVPPRLALPNASPSPSAPLNPASDRTEPIQYPAPQHSGVQLRTIAFAMAPPNDGAPVPAAQNPTSVSEPPQDPYAPQTDADFLHRLLKSVEPKSKVTPGNSVAYDVPANLVPMSDDGTSIATSGASPGTGNPGPGSPAGGAALVSRTPREEVEDQIAAVEGRNTPYAGMGTTVSGRSGMAGYDKMTIQQANFEISGTLNNQIRLSLLVLPTLIDSGTFYGTPTQPFGTLGATVAPPGQSASGIAGEVQLSTEDFGLRFGQSPNGFLVKNWIGGLRYRPGKSPLTFLITRDSVKDSMLSYAGAKDPGTNTAWGGVIANAAQVIGNWGDGNSGFYANASYQSISGTHVAHNTRLDGTVGAYWKLYSGHGGALTAGMNFSAMHYDKNLSYFTYGQGGYFSPQRYFLFSAPLRWTGTWRRQVQYAISGSIGSQYANQATTPYYPLSPSIGFGIPYFPGQTTTGANYLLDFRASYQISPNWFLGLYANVNNARDYASQTASVYVRYMIRPRPLDTDLMIPSLPDWRGTQPFALP